MAFRSASTVILLGLLASAGSAASAQSLGTYSWRMNPYCNAVVVNVTQNGAIYTLDGHDDQCETGTHAAATGIAFVNPNGSVGLGLTIVTAPGAAPVHVDATLDLTTLNGTWTDSHGNSGQLLRFIGGPRPGSPRPLGATDVPNVSITTAKLADGAVTAAKVNAAEVQRRIGPACPAGQLMRGVNQDGSVACETPASGNITSVLAGAGLSGGGSTGAVSLAVTFAGSGSVATAARSDHTHERPGNDGNIAVGPGTLSRTTGVLNTAVGAAAMQLNTSGSSNTGIGRNALLRNSTGSDNTAVGANALIDNTDGVSNVAVGAGALDEMSSGFSNVALGAFSLGNLTTGNSNIAIGTGAGGLLTTGQDNIYIGANGATESGTTRIGRTSQTRTFVTGIRGVTTGQPNAVGVVIDSAGQLGTVSSSRRTKTDIDDLATPITDALQRLRPVQFRYRQAYADGSTPVEYGLIAEEVQDVLPALVALDEHGEPMTVKYHVLPSLLLADVQRLERERRHLANTLSRESARVADLERRLDEQARLLDTLRRASATRLEHERRLRQ